MGRNKGVNRVKTLKDCEKYYNEGFLRDYDGTWLSDCECEAEEIDINIFDNE